MVKARCASLEWIRNRIEGMSDSLFNQLLNKR